MYLAIARPSSVGVNEFETRTTPMFNAFGFGSGLAFKAYEGSLIEHIFAAILFKTVAIIMGGLAAHNCFAKTHRFKNKFTIGGVVGPT